MTATRRSAYGDVLDRLAERGCAPHGRDEQKVARCPAHPDRTPSLSIGRGAEGRVLLTCMAGCPLDAVLTALGLSAADLFDDTLPTPSSARPEIVATYDYADEAGQLVLQVVRLRPKAFRQRRPDGQGGWEWRGLDRPPLYRLPDVLRGIDEGRVIWIAEGERDVNALRRLPGIVATCNPGGAGKWRPWHTATLVGADVRIVADRDEAGRRHAERVATALLPVIHSMEIVEARHGKDAADHLGAGGSCYNFTLVAEPKPWSPPPELAALFEAAQ